MKFTLEPTGDAAWVLESRGYDRLRESSVESRFAISNGFMGVRAGRAMTRGARWRVPARTYVAGLFDTSGNHHGVPGLIPAADWLQTRILLSGVPLVRHPGDVPSYRMVLDMRQGMLLSNGYHSTPSGLGIRGRSLRLASLSDRAIGLHLVELEIEAGTGDITLESSCEGTDLGLVPEQMVRNLGVWRTQHSGKRLAMATASLLQIDGEELAPVVRGDLKSAWRWTARPGQAVWFERIVALVRSDAETQDSASAARERLAAARRAGWRGVVAAHEAAWAKRWRNSDVAVDGDEEAQRALRFALYHLNSAANPEDERVSIGARALTGEDYLGHVFWDTEIYLLPFYSLTWPEAARAMLMYRYHTLGGARAKAARMGWRGAMYAWESADTGDETTPDQVVAPDRRVVDVLTGKQEQHITADVAYAVWHYWRASGDEAFLRDAGAEIILETGRFWASRAGLEADGSCHIRGIIGPDEYHEHVDDNAYTNVMAQWNIRRALEVAELLRKRWPANWARLSGALGLDDAELKQLAGVAGAMATGFDPRTGLFEQFAGYFGLEDIDLAVYAGRSVPMDVVIGRERMQKSRIVKQADVVALLGLLPEAFPDGAAAANFRYYEPRCRHGSSLSPAMHGLVAARLGDTAMALRYLRKTAEIDLGDAHVGIDGGIHIAAQGGLWMLAVLGLGGVSVRDDGLAIDPHLPAGWRGLGFQVQWHRRTVGVRIDRDGQFVEATLDSGEAMAVFVRGERQELQPGLAVRWGLQGDSGSSLPGEGIA